MIKFTECKKYFAFALFLTNIKAPREMKIKWKKCVGMCMCVCVRERERNKIWQETITKARERGAEKKCKTIGK